jgi:hypothetical protein
MDSDRQTACSALKATQDGLADGVTRLRVVTAACGNRALGEEGESFATAGMGSPAPVGGHSLRSQLSPFLPGGLGFSGGGTEGNSARECTILASDNSVGGSFQILQGYERRVNTPLTGDRGETFGRHSEGSRGGGLLSQPPSFRLGAFTFLLREGISNNDEENGAYDVNRGSIPTVGGAGGEEQAKRDGRRLTTRQELMGQLLYGPHGPDTQICRGIIARGLQGQFPDRFCLKTACRFTTHTSKSNLGQMTPGAYYVRENNAYAYAEICLSPEAAALAPSGLLASHNTTVGWKAIIRQLEDQLAPGVENPEEVAAQAEGLAGFAERALKTPYATTPMLANRRLAHLDVEDEEGSLLFMDAGEEWGLRQRLEDSVGLLQGELGVCAPNARYITLHGGVGALGDN